MKMTVTWRSGEYDNEQVWQRLKMTVTRKKWRSLLLSTECQGLGANVESGQDKRFAKEGQLKGVLR